MAKADSSLDLGKFINASQVGGIDAYTIDEGPARGVRALCVNTGAGLRYRILIDRGLDIDQAFYNQHSLTFLSYKGSTRPTRALDRGLDWLKGFAVGLLTSCGPFNIGSPCTDQGEELGLHGPHSNSAATIECIRQCDPHAGRAEMSVVGRIRYGAFYGPCVELCRTITSTLGQNTIRVHDEFYNAGNETVPHAWLLHINFGYPLMDEGSEFCYAEERIEPQGGHEASATFFRPGSNYKRVPGPTAEHNGPNSVVGYIYPRSRRDGMATLALVNRRLSLGVCVQYNTKEFTRCGNWQHWGKHEYVSALEPMTGKVEGRDKDRAAGLLLAMKPGQRISYEYAIAATADREEIAALLALNK